MRSVRSLMSVIAVLLVSAGTTLHVTVRSAELEPLVYTISFPNPASKTFTVQVNVPSDGKPSVDLMMAIWSPGFYGLQNYAQNVSDFTAKTADGAALDVTRPSSSRWRVATAGRPQFTATTPSRRRAAAI